MGMFYRYQEGPFGVDKKKNLPGKYNYVFQFRTQEERGVTAGHRLWSGKYETAANRDTGMAAAKALMTDVTRYAKTKAGDAFVFELQAANGQVVGTSRQYDTEAERDAGIQALKADSPTAGTMEG